MSPNNSQRNGTDLTRYGDWVKSSSNLNKENNKQHLNLEDIDDSYGEVRISQEEENQLGNLDSSTAATEPTEEELDVTEQQLRMFQRIEEEIGTLHDEIRHLKGELHYFQTKNTYSTATNDSRNSSGFFEEDSDETIALTGDELDNIFKNDDMSGDFSRTDPLDDLEIDSVITEFATPRQDKPSTTTDRRADRRGSDSGNSAPEGDDLDFSNLPDDISLENQFEDVSDFEEFGMDNLDSESASTPEVPPHDVENTIEEEESFSSVDIEKSESDSDPFEGAVFDNGEELDIDLGTADNEFSSKEEFDSEGDIKMEEMSLEDFGLSDEVEKEEPIPSEPLQPDPLEEMAYSSNSSSLIDEPFDGIFSTETEAFPEGENVDLEALEDMTQPSSAETAEEDVLPPTKEKVVPIEDFFDSSFEFVDNSSPENEVVILPEEGTDDISVEEPDKTEPVLESESEDIFSEDAMDNDNFFHSLDESNESLMKEEKKEIDDSEALPLQDEIRDILKYMDKLLDALPDEKIREFARSEHFETYKKIFEELGIND